MLNKKRYENSDEKKKRKGILQDYIRGRFDWLKRSTVQLIFWSDLFENTIYSINIIVDVYKRNKQI